jgi:large subunit ribosomal protein L30
MTYAIIRVRGIVNVKPNIKKTLQLLNLTRVNHCVLTEESPSAKGMLQIVKDYVTWGEIEKDTLTKLIKEKGRLEGEKPITEDYLKSATSYKDIEKLVEAITLKKLKFKEIPNVKPLFRLDPPRKGYESVKRAYTKKGTLGYRGKEINKLLEKMLRT